MCVNETVIRSTDKKRVSCRSVCLPVCVNNMLLTLQEPKPTLLTCLPCGDQIPITQM